MPVNIVLQRVSHAHRPTGRLVTLIRFEPDDHIWCDMIMWGWGVFQGDQPRGPRLHLKRAGREPPQNLRYLLHVHTQYE